MRITLEWLGVATFRLTIDGLVVFLDAYIDRVPSAPPVDLSANDVTRADFVLVGHSHFDHLSGAEIIARSTGAKIIGSNETCRVMCEQDVPAAQLLPSHGGERHRLADGVTVRVFPSLHSCTWSGGLSVTAGEEIHGSPGLTQDERAATGAATGGIFAALGSGDERARELREHLTSAVGSRDDGGALVYLVETPVGSILFQDTSGCWTGVLRGLRPDVAILAAAARGNVDGEPMQGSLAQFVAHEAELLRPRTLVLGHHDDWLPPVTRPTDTAPIREEVARRLPETRLLELPYLTASPLLHGA